MIGRKAQSSSKSDSSRLPPGQAITNKFPVLDLGTLPNVDVTNWTLRVFGLVKNELELNFDDLKKYPQVEKVLDFHCVTHWSKFDVPWGGVRALDVMSNVGIMNNAKFVTLYSYDRYTTNIPLKVLLNEDVAKLAAGAFLVPPPDLLNVRIDCQHTPYSCLTLDVF